MSQLLALTSAALYGVADFSGGIATRSIAPWRVVAWSQLLGIPLLLIAIPIVGATAISPADLAFGALGGIFGILGVKTLYRALADGTMSTVSPVTGALTALLPVIVGWLLGETIVRAQWLGIALALVAVILVSHDRSDTRLTPALLRRAMIAAFWFATFFIALDQTSVDAGVFPLVAARAVSVPVAFLIAASTSTITLPGRNDMVSVTIAGVGDMAANIAILLALQNGPLGTSAVLSSLYPAFTVLAAVVVLREHPNHIQWIGIMCAIGAAALLSL